MRNRVISSSEAVYVSTGQYATGLMLWPGGTGFANGGGATINGIQQLHRIQSASYSATVQHTPISQYGQLAPIDRIILQAPTVSLSLDWLVANTYNMNTLGFCTDGSAGLLSGILTKEEDEKNYFISTVRDGMDAILNTENANTKFTIGIGNGFITNFTAAGSVGNFATENISVEGLNLCTYVGATGLASPAIIPASGTRVSTVGNNNFSIPAAVSGTVNSVAAIRPGDITIDFLANAVNANGDPVFGPSISDMKIQSYNLSVPLSRQPLSKLGSPFPFSKELTYPIDVDLTVEADQGDMVTGDLSQLYCNDVSQTIVINLRKPACGGNGDIAVQYKLVNAKFDSQSYSSSIGPNKKVSLKYSASMGGPTDLNSNVFYSGSLT